MPQFQEDGDSGDSLFLLEVLVKEIHYCFSKINLDKSILESLQETCILVKFLHYPAMEIRQESCGSAVDYSAPVVKVGAGKSCLFSLNKKSIACNRKLTAVFNVMRIHPDNTSGCNSVCIGKANADLSKKFLQLVKKACCSTSPVTKCIDECYPLINDQCVKVGEIKVFLRLSCFGNQITTQFKINDRESFVFKGEDAKEDLSVPSECFKTDCDKCGQEYSEGRSTVSPPAWGNYPRSNMYPSLPPQQFNHGQPPQMFPTFYPRSEWATPNVPNFASPYGYGSPPGAAARFLNVGGANNDMYQYRKPRSERDSCSCKGKSKPSSRADTSPCGDPSPCDDPCVPRGSKKSKNKCEEKPKFGMNVIPSFPPDFPFCQRVTIGETESEDTPVPEGPKLNLCDCQYPIPPGLLNVCPPRKPKKKKKAPCPLDFQPGDYCLRSDCPCGLPMVPWLTNKEPVEPPVVDKNAGKFTMAPGSVGLKGKQIIFQMNDKDVPLTEADKKFMAATQYKLGPTGDAGGQKNVIQVAPERIDPDPRTDPNNDIFILKIGKKNDDRKQAKLEIELKTPKFEDKTPIKIDNETQWLDSDAQPGASKKNKKKRKGKKKGGKKGKKKGQKGRRVLK